jgi:signal transduction protein with GAF and PtsI domain
MTDQLEEFTSAVQMMGNSSYDLISRSLVFISVGSNDLFEYVDGNATSCPNRNDTAFLEGLVATYKSYLQVPISEILT